MTGRWPANVILSPGMAEVLDWQSGTSKSTPVGFTTNDRNVMDAAGRSGPLSDVRAGNGYTDSGGASRFFLQAGYESWELKWILDNGLRPCGPEEQ